MAESRYLSLEDFEKTDEKSQEKVMKELNSDNESKQYLYWMKYAMDENDRYRAKMTPLAFRGENELSEETQKNLESKKKDLESEIDAIEHAMESYAEEKGIDLDDVLKEKDDEKDNEDNNLEEEQEEAKAIKQLSDFCKLMNEKLSKLTKKLNAIEKQLENKQNNGGDKEFSDSMNNFNMTAKDEDITCSEELDAVENNLKTAVGLLHKHTKVVLIPPSDIKKLLATFQNLRKTQLDDVLKTIPSDLPTERQKALVTIYKNDFWEAYEKEARDFLSKKTNMLTSRKRFAKKLGHGLALPFKRIENTFLKSGDSLKKIGRKILTFKEDDKKYENVLDNTNFEKELSEDYSIPQGKGDSVQQKIIDLVASTLRPKDAKNDGRSEKNTYGGYYSEIQKIMDKYMKDDDYYNRYNSKEDMKVGELKRYENDGKTLSVDTCNFTYALFAVLMDCAGKLEPSDKLTKMIKLGRYELENMYDRPLVDHEIFKKGSDLKNGKFGKIYEVFEKSCQKLANGDLPKNEVNNLLEQFSSAGVSKRAELFNELCRGIRITNFSTSPYSEYFDKVIKLKDDKEINSESQNK